jgi:thiamine biosynthesis lipoprotein
LYRSVAWLFCGLMFAGISSAQEKKYSFSASKMGSPFNIIFIAADSLAADALAKECYALVDSFNLVFSDYDLTSELSRLNATAGKGAPEKLSPALWDLIFRSQQAYQKSEAAFDITVGPLSKLWRKARKENQFPDPASVKAQKALVGFNRLVTDTKQHTVLLPLAGMQLDAGGIAKGYIAQQVIDMLAKKGITRALADAGGDMVMSNAPPGTAGWTVGVNVPGTTDELLPRKLSLQNKAVATSGDAYQYFEHNGKKYSHIIDPRTGYGITSQRNVTVIAANGADADWLATACSILPIVSAKKLAGSMGAELLITVLKDNKIVYYSTRGFAHYWKH